MLNLKEKKIRKILKGYSLLNEKMFIKNLTNKELNILAEAEIYDDPCGWYTGDYSYYFSLHRWQREIFVRDRMYILYKYTE